MEIVGFLALAATVIKLVGVIKAIGKDTNYVVTQVVTWAVGIAVLFLAAHAAVTKGMLLPGFNTPLESMDGASVFLAGLILGSSGAFAYDVRKSVDNTDTAKESSLTTPASGD